MAREAARTGGVSFLALQAANAPPHAASPADQLPPGDGRDVTAHICTQCHGVATFAQKRYTKDKWDSVLDDMVSKGLNASDDDMNTVEQYLTTYMLPPPDKSSSDSPSASKGN